MLRWLKRGLGWEGLSPLHSRSLASAILFAALACSSGVVHAQSIGPLTEVTSGIRGAPRVLRPLRSLEHGMTSDELLGVYQLWLQSDPDVQNLLLDQTIQMSRMPIRETRSGMWVPAKHAACRARMTDGADAVEQLQRWFEEARNTQQPPNFDDLFEAMPELKATGGILMQDAKAIAGCGRDEGCLTEAVNKAVESNRLQRALGGLCLGRNPNALKGTIVSWLLHLASLTTAYELSAEGRYPADLLFADTITILLYWEIGCRGQFDHGANTPRFKRWARTYWNYLKWTPLEVVLYPGAAMAYDAIMGDEVLTDDKIREYVSQGMFVFAWNAFVGLPTEVTVMDPLYLRAFPAVRRRITEMIERGIVTPLVVRNGTVGRLVRTIGTGSGYGVEAGLQWLLGTGYSWVFLEGRRKTTEAVAPWLPNWIVNPEDMPAVPSRADTTSPPPASGPQIANTESPPVVGELAHTESPAGEPDDAHTETEPLLLKMVGTDPPPFELFRPDVILEGLGNGRELVPQPIHPPGKKGPIL